MRIVRRSPDGQLSALGTVPKNIRGSYVHGGRATMCVNAKTERVARLTLVGVGEIDRTEQGFSVAHMLMSDAKVIRGRMSH
jgi:hypothetical protein